MKDVKNNGIERQNGIRKMGVDSDRFNVCLVYDRIAIVKMKESQKWGVINRDGLFIVEPNWNNIELFGSNYLKATGEFGNVSIFDFNGISVMQVSEYADIAMVNGKLVATLSFASRKVS